MRGDLPKKYYISVWHIDGTLGEYEKILSREYPLEAQEIVWNIAKDAIESGFSVRVSLIDKHVPIRSFDKRW